MAVQFCCISGRQAGIVSVVRFDDVAETADIVSQCAVGAKPLPLIRGLAGRQLLVAAGADPVQLVTLELDEQGALTVVDTVPCPFAPTSMALSPDHRLVAAVCYHESRLAVAAIDGSARIDPNSWVVRPTGRQPHCIVFSPDGRFAYRSELGEDRLVGHEVSGGELVTDDALGVGFPSGAGPRHIVVDRAGSNAYVIEELGGHVVHLRRDVGDGRLTRADEIVYHEPSEGLRHGVYVPPQRPPVEDEQRARIWGADLALDPAGRWLVASERRASTLTLQALEPDGSFGARLDHVRTETQPRAIGLVGDHHVVAGAEKGRTVSFYRVGEKLSLVAQLSGLGGPSWFQTLPA
ncbi:MAG: beta-propeller fold lactonase family protein [Propionibacterium sp.]